MRSATMLSGAARRSETRHFAYGSIAAVLLAAALLSGCNTAKGVGDDVENAAKKVEDAVD
jgi:predicted small secreted protein